MKVGDSWITFPTVDSTQTVAAQMLAGPSCPDVVYAIDQTGGRGRFGRSWVSRPGESLTMSLVMKAYADHPKPWLVGMAVGLGAARALECQVQWPNDLVSRGKKVGGVLTEMFTDSSGRKIPVVGVGINVNQSSFPAEVAEFATSVYLEYGDEPEPVEVARAVIHAVRALHEPTSWSVLSDLWHERDATPGKRYRTPTGEEAVAVGIGPEGELVATVDGVKKSFMAAEALFGPG